MILILDNVLLQSDCDGEDDLAAPFVPLEFELDDGPTIEALIRAYPNSVVG